MIFFPSEFLVIGCFLMAILFYYMSLVYSNKMSDNTNAFGKSYWQAKASKYEWYGAGLFWLALVFGVVSSIIPNY